MTNAQTTTTTEYRKQTRDIAAGRSLVTVDPRYYQLLVQATLLSWGILFLDFSVSFSAVVTVLGAAWVTQLLFTSIYGLRPNLLSATNSAMSVLLLLKANSVLWLTLAVLIAIGSKFLVTFRQRHIFNPSNLGIVAIILLVPTAWAAPGQWGQAMWFLLLAGGFGLGLILGFSRMLTSLSFLAAYSLLTLFYAVWLGDPITIPLHQLQNGALLVFAFFMLSDPMTTPGSTKGRLLYGSLIAVTGWALQFMLYIPNAFLYALALSSPLVPLINHSLPGQRFNWSAVTRRYS